VANGLARALHELAEAYRSASQFEQAEQLLKLAMSNSQLKLADKELREEIATSYVETLRLSGKKEQLAAVEPHVAKSHSAKSAAEQKWEDTLAQAEDALTRKRSFDLAERLSKQAIKQAEQDKLGTAKVAKGLLLLARVQEAAQQTQDAQQTYDAAVNMLMKSENYGLSNNDLSMAVAGLLSCLAIQRKDAEFERTATRLVNSLESLRGPYDLIVNRAQLLRVQALETLERFGEAASAAKQMIRNLEHVPQPPNSAGRLLLTKAQAKLTVEYQKLGKWNEAEKYLEQSLKAAKEDDDFKNVELQKNWDKAVAGFVADAPPDMALRLAESWYQLTKEQFGEEEPTCIAAISRAEAYAKAGKHLKAKAEYESCLTRLREKRPTTDPHITRLEADLGDLGTTNFARVGESTEAAWQRLEHSGEYWAQKSDRARSERAFLAALQLAGSLQNSPERLVQTLTQLGRVYYLLQPINVPKAKELFQRAEGILSKLPTPTPPYPEELYHRLIEIYGKEGNTDEIIQLGKRWVKYFVEKTGNLSWQTYDCQQSLINTEIGTRKYAQAEQDARQWYAAISKLPKPLPNSKLPMYAMSVHLLLSSYENQGKWKEAEALLLKELLATRAQKALTNKLVFSQYGAEIGWFSAHGPAAGAKKVSDCWNTLVREQLGPSALK
jgi:hypothetical protein